MAIEYTIQLVLKSEQNQIKLILQLRVSHSTEQQTWSYRFKTDFAGSLNDIFHNLAVWTKHDTPLQGFK